MTTKTNNTFVDKTLFDIHIPWITSFRGPYRFLSNFSQHGATYEGVRYQTAEHAYQAAKTDSPAERTRIFTAESPAVAKIMGRKLVMRPDWDRIKIPIMKDIIRSKFSTPSLCRMLKDTGKAMLIEGNTWGDEFWGATWNGKEWIGQNWLGWLLMEQRRSL